MKVNKVFDAAVTEFKEDGDSGYVTAYASVFGNIDGGNDRMMKGSFKRTLGERDSKVIYLPSHDYRAHIGSIPAVPVSIEEDSKGLKTVSRFLLNTTAGKDSYEVLKAYQEAGRPLGLSFTFDIQKSRYVHEKNAATGRSIQVREIDDVNLYEYGHCPLPMNEEARTVSVKGGDVTTEGTSKDGSMTTIGSMLTASVYDAITDDIADLIEDGNVTTEEAIALTAAVGSLLSNLDSSLGDLAGREVECDDDWWDSWSRDTFSDAKGLVGKHSNIHELVAKLTTIHDDVCEDSNCTLHGAAKAEWFEQPSLAKLNTYYDVLDGKIKGIKAVWATNYINDLPDSAFAVIKSGGTKDSQGRTEPRELRMLPHHDDSGQVSPAHLKVAANRLELSKTDLTDSERSEAESHLEKENNTSIDNSVSEKERTDIDELEKLLASV